MITQAWYLEALPKYKAAFEDGTILLPRDADILNDHRAAELVRGIPQIPDKRTKGADGGKRHGDSLIAGAMAYWASIQEVREYAYQHATARSQSNAESGRMHMRPRDDEDDIHVATGRNGLVRGKSW